MEQKVRSPCRTSQVCTALVARIIGMARAFRIHSLVGQDEMRHAGPHRFLGVGPEP